MLEWVALQEPTGSNSTLFLFASVADVVAAPSEKERQFNIGQTVHNPVKYISICKKRFESPMIGLQYKENHNLKRNILSESVGKREGELCN